MTQFSVIFIFALFALAAAKKTQWFDLSSYSFENYVEEYGKTYGSTEERSLRRSIFEAKLGEIKRHNEDKTKTWKAGINHMSDWTRDELKKLSGYKRSSPVAATNNKEILAKKNVSALPMHVDWRDRGVVSPVKDQGMCGSCWTFGTTESIESFFALKHGELMDFSEQQILDCTPNPNQCGGTGGCGGGTAELAMARIINMGGLTSEWMYSYNSYSGKNFQCHFSDSSIKPIAKLSSYVTLPSNQYSPVMSAVAYNGPLIISVDASAWFEYESGVFDGCNQTNPDIDHAVQLVGYGTDPELGNYYLVRNSWSALWGEKGYIRLRRTGSESTRCGTDLSPSDGTGCKDGPPTVKVCGTCGILYDVSYPIMA